ncbi:beta-lactamase-like protein 2 [Phanerochaete sordida]|uniref:Beta-lactamase-like protein 2 n=1 Tax=Phanerochaete sordida TaxID=48140 RepID=A0A9P3G4B0_9APHY|nr:beta-lactamase-like protein 2 [Phanerochaete sordida]
MSTAQTFPSITRLSKNVVRLLGQNPGKFTLQGTNTYLVGQTNPYILVDTGEGRDSYIPILDEALGSPTNDAPEIGDIIFTHRHHDHTDGLPSVLALLQRRWSEQHPNTTFPAPRVHKLPLTHPKLDALFETLPQGSYTPNASGGVLHDLHEGQTLTVTSVDGDTAGLALEIVHTPGHTPDSLCLLLAADRALFTADTVLGQSSTVFEDLGAYMSSLRKLGALNAAVPGRRYDTLYPGHGPTVPHDHVGMYLQHRVDRENQVLDAIAQAPPEGDAWTTWTLVGNIYARYPKELWEPAAQSVNQHLQKLEAEGRVQRLGGEERHVQWKLLA